MKRRTIILSLLLVGIFIYFLLQDFPHLLIYDAERHIVYDENYTEPLIEGIFNPIMGREDKVIGVFTGSQPYIGYYDLRQKEIKNIIYLDKLENVLNEKMATHDINNIQFIKSEPLIISFISDNKLYRYNEEAGIEIIWEFSGKMSERPYGWLNNECIVLLDEAKILEDWKLFLINIETEQKTLIDSSVSAFVISEEIIYSKKYYMGSWCEWELHFVNQDLQNTKNVMRSSHWSVGDMVLGDDNKLYFLSSTSGTMDKMIEIYQLNNGVVPVRKVYDIPRGDKLIGVMDDNQRHY